MFFLCSLVIFLGVKEQRPPDGSDVQIPPPFITSFKLLLRFVPYQRLVLGFTISTFAFQISMGNFALFCSHAAGLGHYFQLLLLVLLGSATIAVPIWQVVLLKIGKKPTIFIGLTLFIPAVVVVACVPWSLAVFITMCVVMGFSVATVSLLPWSMLPDVVDEFTMRNPQCKDLEPMFFSCYAFCNKLAGSLAAGVSTMTLQFVGYKSGACNHSDEVVTALLVLFSPVPIALLLLGMLVFLFYPINEKLKEQITTVDSKVLASSNQTDQREFVEETLCVTMNVTAHASSDRIRSKSNKSSGKYSRPKCVVHPNVYHHSAADNERNTRETNTNHAPLELETKVSWV